MSSISVKNLTVKFGKNMVLKNVTFKVEKGDFYAIIGPNGGGKSVLIKTILGLIKAESGKVCINNKDIRQRKDFKIGYVPQFIHYDISFPITALEVAIMGRLKVKRLGKQYTQEDFEIVKDKLERVDIGKNIYNKPFTKLSGGQRQRVLIARALASEPDILILDEPTASVDSVIVKKLYQVFKKLNEKGVSILMVTHDMGMISKYITKIACLNKTLHTHDNKYISADLIKKTYGCSIDILGHGLPHRVLKDH